MHPLMDTIQEFYNVMVMGFEHRSIHNKQILPFFVHSGSFHTIQHISLSSFSSPFISLDIVIKSLDIVIKPLDIVIKSPHMVLNTRVNFSHAPRFPSENPFD